MYKASYCDLICIIKTKQLHSQIQYKTQKIQKLLKEPGHILLFESLKNPRKIYVIGKSKKTLIELDNLAEEMLLLTATIIELRVQPTLI